MAQGMSRRSFLTGAFAGSALMAAGSLIGCAPKASTDTPSGSSTTPDTVTPGTATIKSTRPNPGEGHPTSISPAGADAEPIAPVAVPASWDKETDVVVVGSGFGGLTAGLYLLQNGLKVVIVEKSGMVGGAGRHACNLHVNCGVTKAQNELG